MGENDGRDEEENRQSQERDQQSQLASGLRSATSCRVGESPLDFAALDARVVPYSLVLTRL